MPSKSTIRQTKYDNDHTVRYALKLNKTTDRDIILEIERTARILETSKQGAIKGLLRVAILKGVTIQDTIQKEKRG